MRRAEDADLEYHTIVTATYTVSGTYCILQVSMWSSSSAAGGQPLSTCCAGVDLQYGCSAKITDDEHPTYDKMA